jgi:GntR family galactonate operon transcriptional repressor
MAMADLDGTSESTTSFVRVRVLEALGQRIVAGHYPVGSNLPTEAQLCDEFGVSRTAMREAIKMLSAKGLVESRQRAGTRILPANNWNRLDPDVLDWSSSDPDPDFMQALIEARQVIEPAAARMAASRATSADLAEIEAGYMAMKAAPLSDLAACAEADVQFHLAILQASHNPVFMGLGNLIKNALSNSFRLTTSVSRSYVATLEAHGDVLEAVRLRQPDIAHDRMRSLIDIASSDFLRHAHELKRDAKQQDKA